MLSRLLSLFFSITAFFAVIVTVAWGYYDYSPKEGYWWYKEEKKSEKQQKQPEKTPEQQSEQIVAKPLNEYTYEELLYMNPDEFKKVFDYYQKQAIARPTEENLWHYYNLVDVMRKKAVLFTQASMYFMQKYPELSVERDIPTINPGVWTRTEKTIEETSSSLKTQDYGLIVFVQPGCVYCDAQLSILKYYEQNHAVPVKVVDITRESEAAAMFGVTVTPTIVVVSKNTKDWMPVSSGVISLEEIEARVYKALRYIDGKHSAGQWGLFEFQKGSSLDPTQPSPLWKEKRNK